MSDSEKHDESISKPRGNGKVVAVENVAFSNAVAKAHVNPWSKRMIQMYGLCLLATLNACINGYDGSLMSSINAMESYQKKFEMIPTGAATGFVFAIYSKIIIYSLDAEINHDQSVNQSIELSADAYMCTTSYWKYCRFIGRWSSHRYLGSSMGNVCWRSVNPIARERERERDLQLSDFE